MTKNLTVVENFPISGDRVRFIKLSEFLNADNSWLDTFFSLSSDSKEEKIIIVQVQSRVRENPEWIESLAEIQRNGDSEGRPWNWDKEPPLVYGTEQTQSGAKIYFLVNGIHRTSAAIKNGFKVYPRVHFVPGTRQQAIEQACGPVNRGSPYPELVRQRGDLKKGILLLLQDDKWWAKPDQKIADHCHGSHTSVQVARKFYLENLDNPEELKKWGLRVPVDPQAERMRLEKLEEVKTVQVNGKERSHKVKRTKTEEPEDLNPPQAKKDHRGSGRDTEDDQIESNQSFAPQSCSINIEPQVRDKAQVLAKKLRKSVPALITECIHNYEDWMDQIEALQETLEELNKENKFLSSQLSKLGNQPATLQKEETFFDENELDIAYFRSNEQREVKVAGSHNEAYCLEPGEELIVQGTCVHQGKECFKVKPRSWNEYDSHYILLAKQDVTYEPVLQEDSVFAA